MRRLLSFTSTHLDIENNFNLKGLNTCGGGEEETEFLERKRSRGDERAKETTAERRTQNSIKDEDGARAKKRGDGKLVALSKWSVFRISL